MSRKLFHVLFILVAFTTAAVAAQAQEPSVTHAPVVHKSVAALDADFRALVAAQSEPAWIGYTIPIVEGRRFMCCDRHDSAACCGGCRLEADSSEAVVTSGPARDTVRLEGSDRFHVLFRVASRRVERIRAYSAACTLDVGGRTLYWLSGVTPKASVALLRGFAASPEANGDDRIESAIMAIAMHGDPAADTALDALGSPDHPVAVRKKVAFWLGNARGRHGLDSLQRMLREDDNDDVRKAVVFGISQSDQPDAFETLVSVSRTDRSEPIRGEALFWMAQRGDPRAGQAILEALAKDPAHAVRKKAVFALSQLPDDAGVPHLVTAARTHESADVRAEALFWLSQKAGSKAAGAITEAIANDPETEVKKRAVFALSQLPKDEGVPRLIEVARTNRNPAVRKQAMFWLGQSKDPRALAFFEDVLK